MIWHGSRRRFAPLLAAILIGAVVPGARMAGAAAGAGSAAAGTAPPAVAPLPPPDAEIPPPEPAPREVGKAPPSPAPARPDAVFCPVCGARNHAGSHFCLKDGTPLPPIDPERFDPRFVRAAETYSPEEIQETIHRTSGSVVRIRVKTSMNLKYPVSGKTGLVGWLEVVDEEARLVGSGFAVGAPGEIVTNAHVVCPFGTPAQISVDTQAGRSFPARLVGVDQASDLAVVKIDSGSVPALAWGDSSVMRLGDETWAIGYPLDIGLSVSRGTISSLGRMRAGFNQIESYLHSDAFITHGNSGGPLVDVLGRVVGVSDMGFNDAKGQGYSIPASMARYVTEKLRAQGKYERGFVGLQARPLDPEIVRKYAIKRGSGVVVEAVLPGSPAAAAGFRPGDVLFGINGRQALYSYLIQEAVSSVGPGARLTLSLERGGQVLDVPVTTGTRPREPRIDPLLDLETSLMVRFEADANPRKKGVVIRIPDSFSIARKFRLTDGVRLEAALAAEDWPDKETLDKFKFKPTPIGSLDDLRALLRRAYLGGRIAVALHLDRSDDSDIWVAPDETWPIIL